MRSIIIVSDFTIYRRMRVYTFEILLIDRYDSIRRIPYGENSFKYSLLFFFYSVKFGEYRREKRKRGREKDRKVDKEHVVPTATLLTPSYRHWNVRGKKDSDSIYRTTRLDRSEDEYGWICDLSRISRRKNRWIFPRNDFVIHRVKIAASIPFERWLGVQVMQAACIWFLERA